MPVSGHKIHLTCSCWGSPRQSACSSTVYLMLYGSNYVLPRDLEVPDTIMVYIQHRLLSQAPVVNQFSWRMHAPQIAPFSSALWSGPRRD